MQSHIRKVYACLAVTCHLHFWQNEQGLSHATAVTRGWNGDGNRSQHRKLTLQKKILRQGFEPATFQSWVQRSNHWAIPTLVWNNNNEYLECLSHPGPKHVHILYKYLLSKFSTHNMNTHTHTHTCMHTHTKHVHTHTHTPAAYQGNGAEEKVFKKRKIWNASKFGMPDRGSQHRLLPELKRSNWGTANWRNPSTDTLSFFNVGTGAQVLVNRLEGVMRENEASLVAARAER